MLSLLNTTFTNTLRQGFTLIGRLLSKLKARSTYFENQTCTKATLQEIDSAGLLEKASIITTPTAYSDGFINSVKPEQNLGSELITNGGFDTSIPIGTAGSGWRFIDSGNAGSTAEYYQGGVKLTRTTNLSRLRPLVGNTTSTSFFPLESRNYVISYDLISTTDSSKNVSLSAGGVGVQLPGTVGSHIVYFKNNGTSTLCQFSPGSNTDIVLDNISMKEVIDADFTFIRNNPGTRVNEQGLIESVAGDLARINYLGGCGSWLLEPSRTNLILTSARGTYGNNPGSEANTISPDGTNNAVIPTPDSTSDRYERNIGNNTYATNTKLVYSWYRKRISTPIDTSFLGDLQFKTLVNVTQVGSTIQIQSDVNGFDRFQAVLNITDGSSYTTIRAYFGHIIGIGNSSVAYFGHQLEVGSYATSYIPTSGSTVTRGADSALDSGSSDLISSTEGVLYFEVAALTSINNFESISLSDGSTQNRIRFQFLNTLNRAAFQVQAGGVNQMYKAIDFTDITDFNKIAIKYKQNDFSVWLNGVKIHTDTSGTIPTLSELNFSAGATFNNFYGKAKCVAVFKEALTDAELTALTS